MVPTINSEYYRCRARPSGQIGLKASSCAGKHCQKRRHRRGCGEEAADASNERTAPDHGKAPRLADVEGDECSERGEQANAFVAPHCARARIKSSEIEFLSQAALAALWASSNARSVGRFARLRRARWHARPMSAPMLR